MTVVWTLGDMLPTLERSRDIISLAEQGSDCQQRPATRNQAGQTSPRNQGNCSYMSVVMESNGTISSGDLAARNACIVPLRNIFLQLVDSTHCDTEVTHSTSATGQTNNDHPVPQPPSCAYDSPGSFIHADDRCPQSSHLHATDFFPLACAITTQKRNSRLVSRNDQHHVTEYSAAYICST